MKRLRHKQRWMLGCVAIAVVSTLCAGCGPRRPETATVTGVVTYRGAPVEGAQVMFIAKEGRSADGKTDASGRFTLQTFDSPDGAILGEHTVLISKEVPVPKDQLSPDFRPGGRFSRYPQMRETLPERYTSPIDSPLKVTVTADGENHFDFQLEN